MHSILEYLFEYCNGEDDDNPYIRHGRIERERRAGADRTDPMAHVDLSSGSAYVLSLKRAVREAEEVGEGDTIVVEPEVLDL